MLTGNKIPLTEFQINPLVLDRVIATENSRGREYVSAAVKTIQRFCLQLDRSDGRPDISFQTTAEKFYDFVMTCLRTEGPAWTAVIGPFDYIGLRFKDYVSISGDVRRVDLQRFSAAVGAILLDTPVQQTCPELVMKNRSSFLDLNLALTRCILRYAIFQDVLEGADFKSSNLLLDIDDDPNCYFPVQFLESVLCIDMNVPYVKELTKVSIAKADVEIWAAHNKLE